MASPGPPTPNVFALHEDDPLFQPFQGDADGEPRTTGAIDFGADEHWPGLALAYPSPGLARLASTLSARGAPRGALVVFWAGSAAGLRPLGFEACPQLAVAVANPSPLGGALADAAGETELRLPAPASLAGCSLLLQATFLAPGPSGPTCAASNRVAFTFPSQ